MPTKKQRGPVSTCYCRFGRCETCGAREASDETCQMHGTEGTVTKACLEAEALRQRQVEVLQRHGKKILEALRADIANLNGLANGYPEGHEKRKHWFAKADEACRAYDSVAAVVKTR